MGPQVFCDLFQLPWMDDWIHHWALRWFWILLKWNMEWCTDMYPPSGWEGESICLSSTYIYSEKCQNSSAISGTWAGERETTVFPARAPLNLVHVSQQTHSAGLCYRNKQKTNPDQTCLIFHIPSNLSTSITGGSEIQWNKSDVCVYEGSSAEDVVFLNSAWFLYLWSYSSPQS